MTPFLQPTYILAILIAISVHEGAHAFMAYRLGDPTAKHEGRLTLNPLAHLDPIGALMFLLVGFGWAKPVPIDPRYFKHYKRDTALTAAAGPVSNLILAWLSFFVLLATHSGIATSPLELLTQEAAGSPALALLAGFCRNLIFINLALMAFNLLPIPPLDGSKMLQLVIPRQHELAYQRYLQQGQSLLIFVLIIDIVFNIPILKSWVFGVMTPLLILMNLVTTLVL